MSNLKVLTRALNIVFIIWFVPMAAILLNLVKPGTELYVTMLAVHIIGAIALFCLLGLSAKYSNRSWVKYGVLPIFIPIVGPVVSYLLIQKNHENT